MQHQIQSIDEKRDSRGDVVRAGFSQRCQSRFSSSITFLISCYCGMIAKCLCNFFQSRSQLANKYFFFSRPVLKFSTYIFLKSNNSRFKKEEMGFLKSRFACNSNRERIPTHCGGFGAFPSPTPPSIYGYNGNPSI